VISLAEPSLFSAVRFILLPSADSSAQAPYFVSARAGAPVPSSVLPAAIFSSVRCRRCAACYWLHRIRFLISTYSKSVFSSLIEACQHAVVSAPSLSGSRRFWKSSTSALIFGLLCVLWICFGLSVNCCSLKPVLFFSYQIKKLEFFWFQSLSRGGFLNTSITYSVKWLRVLELIFLFNFCRQSRVFLSASFHVSAVVPNLVLRADIFSISIQSWPS
jgi:hypothetical protein